jgi:hypothetical protein
LKYFVELKTVKNMLFQMGPKPSFWTKMKNIWQTNIGVMKFPFLPVVFHRSKAGVWIVGEVGEGNGLRT